MTVDVADTAVLTLACRAAEAGRPRPRYLDPFAGRLLAALDLAVPLGPSTVDDSVDVVVARARLVDRAIGRLGPGLGFLLNLGAGYDMRPSFVESLADRPVVEVDSAPVLAAKETALGAIPGARPVLRVAADLTRPAALDLHALPARAGAVLTEGVLQYLPPDVVAELAAVLAADRRVDHWITDLVSAGAAGWMSGRLRAAGGGVVGATPALVEVLERGGWTAARIDPLPIELRAMGSDSGLARALPSTQGSGPGDAVVLLRRRGAPAI